jgi:RNA polymerase subunit RPABC4/transcription elongation factor Spt4
MTEKRICPICGKEYTDFPAISRKDNKTEICPECGQKEAFEALKKRLEGK